MLTDDYKAQLQLKHAQDKWGTTGCRNMGPRIVQFLKERRDVKTVLDFGAGQQTLMEYVRDNLPHWDQIVWTNYDPGIPGIDEAPEKQFDLIVSSDVLEHIEPEQLPAVLKWLYEHTKYYMFFLIACDPCYGKLPDGRNAHLIVETPEWWKDRLKDHGTPMMWAKEIRRKRRSERTICLIQIDKA